MNDIRHIVFDVGKVLVHYDPHLAYSDLIADRAVGSSRVDLQACKLEYSIVSPK